MQWLNSTRIKRLNQKQKDTITYFEKVFVSTFADDKIIQSWLPTHNNSNALSRLYNFNIKRAMKRGGLVYTDDNNAFAIYSIETGGTWENILELFFYLRIRQKFSFSVTWSLWKTIRAFSIKSKYGKYLYVRFLVVEESARGKGVSTSIFKSLADYSNTSSIALAYETSEGVGKSFFTSLGAETYKILSTMIIILRPK